MTVKITLMPPLTPAGVVLEVDGIEDKNVLDRLRQMMLVVAAISDRTCPRCKGQGIDQDQQGQIGDCIECKGRGVIPQSDECPKCHGAGETRSLGNGRATCEDCEGTGKVGAWRLTRAQRG